MNSEAFFYVVDYMVNQYDESKAGILSRLFFLLLF